MNPNELIWDAEALRDAAALMSDLGRDPEDIALVLAGAEIAERRAARIFDERRRIDNGKA